jgi:predicted nucleic acid-binding protein
LIAIDTSSLRRYLRDEVSGATARVARAVMSDEAMLPPIVLTEALSDVNLSEEDRRRTLEIPLMPLFNGYWYRAGNLRRRLFENRLKAPAADCLVAQACLDMGIPLIASDREFMRFIPMGLKLFFEV